MTEQIEFHVFGGSGSAGVTSSLVSLGRSFTAFIILLPIMYYACENDNKDALGTVHEWLLAASSWRLQLGVLAITLLILNQ